MKREDVKELFPEITDDQLKKLMDMAGSDVNQAKASAAKQVEEANANAKALQAQVDELNAAKQRNMTAEEQLKQQLDEVIAKQAETQQGYNRMSAKAKLAALGLPDDVMEGLLDKVVTEDAEATNANAEFMANLISAQRRDAFAEALKKAQADVSMPGGGGSDGGTVTREQFDSMSYAERLKVYEESPETYQQLTQGE